MDEAPPDRNEPCERDPAEQELIDRLKLAEAVFTHSISSLAVLDRNYNFLRVNNAYARGARREVSEFPGRNHFEMYPSDAKPIFDEVVRSKAPFTTVTRAFVFPDQPERGVTYWDWTLVPILNQKNEVEYLVLSLVEVTERYRAEDALRESEARYRRQAAELELIYRTAPVGLCVLDTQLRYVHINEYLAAINGLPPEAHIGKTAKELIPQVAAAVDPLLLRVLKTGKPMVNVETSAETPAQPGVQRTWMSHFWPLKGDDAAITGITMVVEEVTERRRLEETRLREKEFRTLAENSTDVVTRWDRMLRRRYVNPAIEAVLERPRAEFIGRTNREAGMPVEVADQVDRQVQQVFATGRTQALEITLPTPKGPRVFDTRLVPELSETGKVETVLSISRDITQRKRAEEALQRERNFFDTVLDTQGAIVAVLDRHYRIVRLNRAYYAITGFPAGSKIGRAFSELIKTEAAGTTTEHLLNALITRQTTGEFDSALSVRDGSVRHVSWRTTAQRNKTGDVDHIVATGIDITERRRMEERTRHLADHDALTDLPNRRLLIELLEAALQSARRGHSKVAMLFLDLDRFKIINDTLGHDAGDTLLKEVARRLAGRVRRSDIVARLGGDEFAVLLGELTQGEQAADVAREIVHTFQRPFRLAGQRIHITASLGISLFPDDSDTADGLLRRADLAMYDAKEQGRNTFRFYNLSVDHRARERARIESSLRQALERDELRLVYQPEVELRTGRVVGAEALVRWQHPELGLLDPCRFIPVAEETGLITLLDDWVLHHVCAQAQRWLEQRVPPLRVAINVSAKRFERAGLVETVRSHLSRTGLAPQNLELELTEHTVMHHIDRGIERMRELVALGLSIAVDDFGTGYSSLSYLKQLPIGKLKIERSFVRDIASDADDRAIIQAITALAHTMNKQVIAEGVETEEQKTFLAATGCDEAQGFLFAKPLAPEHLVPLLVHL